MEVKKNMNEYLTQVTTYSWSPRGKYSVAIRAAFRQVATVILIKTGNVC